MSTGVIGRRSYGGSMSRQHRLLPLLFAALLVVAVTACGSDGGEDTSSPDGTTSSDTAATGDGSADDSGGGGPAGAVVVIGDETYEATNEVTCITMGGALGSQFMTDDETVTINIDVPPEGWESDTTNDWDPPSIRVDDDRVESDSHQWVAGSEELEMNGGGSFSSVDTFSLGDGTVSGEATFIDNFDLTNNVEPTPITGTFELTCG